MLTLEKFEQASELVKKVTLPTKLVYSEYLSEQTGGKVYLKPENMQYTGSYKVRGAYYKITTMTEEEREKGREEGIELGILNTIKAMLKNNLTYEDISKITDKSLDEIKEIEKSIED